MKKFIDSNLEFIVTMLGIVIVILILLLGNHFTNIKNKYESDISFLNVQVNQLILDREVHLSELEKLSNEISILSEENDNYLLQIDELNQNINTKNDEIKKLNEDLVSKKQKEEEERQLAIQKQKEQEEAKKVVATNSEPKTVSRNSSPAGSSTEMYFDVSFYSAHAQSTGKNKGDKGYGITASGAVVQEGVTAACPPSMTLGTKLYVEGFGYLVCQDRGGAIKGHNRIDIYVESQDRAMQLGRQKIKGKVFN